MGITVHNDTPHRRAEYVIYGSNEHTTCSCFTVPGAHINVAYVDVDAHSPGYGEAETPAEDGNRGTFISHPAVDEAFAANFEYRATINGRTGTFRRIERLVDSPRLRVDRWLMRDGVDTVVAASQGTFQLFTYWFHNHATIRFELLYFYENLTAQYGPVPALGFQVSGPNNLRQLVVYDVADPDRLMAGFAVHPLGNLPPGQMKDACGASFEGCLPFETAQMRAARTTHPEAITQSAQMLHPLYSLVPHPTWGLWAQTPLTWTQAQRDLEYAYAHRFDVGLSNPNAHLGYITDMRPAATGGQPEYGAWTHAYNIGDQDSRSMWPQHRAAMKHANRPVWYTEATGEPLIPASNAFPDARIWDERIHWQQSPVNRFRRAVGVGEFGSNNNFVWWGHDVEHVGWNLLADDFLLNGSFAARHLLIMINSNMAAHTLDSSGMSEPRSVGRWYMGAAMIYRATGRTEPLLHGVDMWPQIYANWLSRCAPSDPFRPYLGGNRGIAGYAPNTWVWTAWQSGILIAGLDAALRMDAIAGIFSPTMRAEMEEVQLADARALVNLAFAPAHSCGSTNFADGEKWAKDMNFGTGAIPVCPTSVDFCDSAGSNPNRPIGLGGFEAAWVIMGVRIARRLDAALAARCDIIENFHRPAILAWNPNGNTAADRLPQYLGAG